MNLPFHHNARQKTFANARSLKKAQTKAEEVLWQHLRNRRLSGMKFRRQHPVGSFIADFYCHEALLVIEVDGHVHLTHDNPEYDLGRTKDLEDFGLRVIRFTNDQVLQRIEFVLSEIRKYLKTTPFSSQEKGRG